MGFMERLPFIRFSYTARNLRARFSHLDALMQLRNTEFVEINLRRGFAAVEACRCKAHKKKRPVTRLGAFTVIA